MTLDPMPGRVKSSQDNERFLSLVKWLSSEKNKKADICNLQSLFKTLQSGSATVVSQASDPWQPVLTLREHDAF